MTTPSPLHSLRRRNRGCTACPLHAGCKSPVPSSGRGDVEVMLVGEAPGKLEDLRGQPFIGPAGEETTNYLERYARIHRGDVFITNTVRCRPPGNRTPYEREVEACWEWFAHELGEVQPKFIIAAGATALHALLGYSYDIDMWHGIPIEVGVSELGKSVDKTGLLATLAVFSGWVGKVTVIPTYHPAYGLHDGGKMKALQDDFTAVGRVVRGMYRKKVDEWEGRESYTSGELLGYTTMMNITHDLDGGLYESTDIISLDTEFEDGKMWCLSVANSLGEGRVVFPDDDIDMAFLRKWVQDPSHTVVFHNALADLPILAAHDIHPVSVTDTMIMAYVLQGMGQGLKTLAFRECGMEMESYAEVVKTSTEKRAIEYLYEVLNHPWPDPPPFYKWTKDSQKLTKPWNIRRTVEGILRDYGAKGVDPVARWRRVDEWKGRKMVEEELGPMPYGRLGDIDREKAIRYSARDADATMRVYRVLEPRIRKEGLEGVLALDVAILPILNDMMTTGMKVDVEVFKKMSEEHGRFLADLEPEIALSGGMVINPSSRDQVANLLFGKLGIKAPAKTKTGLDATDNEALNLVVDKHPVVPLIITHREWSKRKTAFLDPLPRWAKKDGRVHTRIRNTVAVTGRLSSAVPNLQQIPQRSKEGRRIKEGFVAAEGCSLVCADYSQIELRMLGHMSQDDGLLDAFWDGIDLHSFTAAKMTIRNIGDYDEPRDIERDLERYQAKTANFGIPYGLTPEGLMVKMKAETHGKVVWTLEEAGDFQDSWFDAFPGVRDYMEEVFRQVRLDEYSLDMFGRRRLVPEVRSALNYVVGRGLREGFNHIMQGGAQGVIKKAMENATLLYQEFRRREYVCNPLMQVHDELIFEVGDDILDEFVPRLKETMEDAVMLVIPTPVGVGVGKTWAEAK